MYGGVDWQSVDLGYGISTILATDIPYLIVPFFVELLSYEDDSTKAWILSMLRFLAEYVDFHDEGEIYRERAMQIREAVWNEHDSYLNLLHHASASVRFAAFNTLSTFSEHIQDLLLPLLKAIETETDADTKALMIWYLKNLSPKNGMVDTDAKYLVTQFLHELVVSDDHAFQLVAAMILICFLKAEAPSDIIAIVVQSLIDEGAPPPFHPPFLGEKERAKSILESGVEKGLPAAIEIIKATRHVENGCYAMMIALILAFTPATIPEFGIRKLQGMGWNANEVNFRVSVEENFKPDLNLQTLSPSQQTVIAALVETDWIWWEKFNALEIFKLPAKRDALAKLLSDTV